MELQNFYVETVKISDTGLLQTLIKNSQIKFIKKGDMLQHIGSINTELYVASYWMPRGGK